MKHTSVRNQLNALNHMVPMVNIKLVVEQRNHTVIGAVERGGKVTAKVTLKSHMPFVRERVDTNSINDG